MRHWYEEIVQLHNNELNSCYVTLSVELFIIGRKNEKRRLIRFTAGFMISNVIYDAKFTAQRREICRFHWSSTELAGLLVSNEVGPKSNQDKLQFAFQSKLRLAFCVPDGNIQLKTWVLRSELIIEMSNDVRKSAQRLLPWRRMKSSLQWKALNISPRASLNIQLLPLYEQCNLTYDIEACRFYWFISQIFAQLLDQLRFHVWNESNRLEQMSPVTQFAQRKSFEDFRAEN